MQTIKTKTVGEIVSENYLMSDVFLKYGIDYCNNGHKSLAEICHQKALNPLSIENELLEIERLGHRTHAFDNWQIDYLIDHIINTHHYFVWVNLPIITSYSLKLNAMPGTQYPRLVEASRLLKELSSEIERHLLKEEHTVFPHLKALFSAWKHGTAIPKSPRGSLKMTLYTLEIEHEHIAAGLKMIAILCHEFKPPKGAPETLRVFYSKLKRFQEDFYEHTHLENNILFPKALKLPKSKTWSNN